jgi:hypothetical protein
MLKYNTLYQSLKKVSAEWHAGHIEWFYTWNYLKFFEDGIFISASIAGDDSSLINKAFIKGAENTTHGNFEIQSSNIKLLFNDSIRIEGAINNDNSVILEGKLNWDVFYPLD